MQKVEREAISKRGVFVVILESGTVLGLVEKLKSKNALSELGGIRQIRSDIGRSQDFPAAVAGFRSRQQLAGAINEGAIHAVVGLAIFDRCRFDCRAVWGFQGELLFGGN